MNGVCAIIVFLCVQELTTASYYRVPKRYFKILPKQEIKQAKNVPIQTVPTRSLPLILPIAEDNIITNVNLAETLLPEVSEINIEPDNENTVSNQVPILKPYKLLAKHDLPKMPTLPILALLPIVASLPVVNVAPKVTGKLPDAVVNVTNDSLDGDDNDANDIYLEEIEESDVTTSMSVVQEVKYEIVERRQKKSEILHKIHKIDEFKRNILVERRDDPRSLGKGGERDGSMDLKEYLQRIAERAELIRH